MLLPKLPTLVHNPIAGALYVLQIIECLDNSFFSQVLSISPSTITKKTSYRHSFMVSRGGEGGGDLTLPQTWAWPCFHKLFLSSDCPDHLKLDLTSIDQFGTRKTKQLQNNYLGPLSPFVDLFPPLTFQTDDQSIDPSLRSEILFPKRSIGKALDYRHVQISYKGVLNFLNDLI